MHVPLETSEKISMGHIPRDYITGPQAMNKLNVTKYKQIALECLNHTTLLEQKHTHIFPRQHLALPSFLRFINFISIN